MQRMQSAKASCYYLWKKTDFFQIDKIKNVSIKNTKTSRQAFFSHTSCDVFGFLITCHFCIIFEKHNKYSIVNIGKIIIMKTIHKTCPK